MEGDISEEVGADGVMFIADVEGLVFQIHVRSPEMFAPLSPRVYLYHAQAEERRKLIVAPVLSGEVDGDNEPDKNHNQHPAVKDCWFHAAVGSHTSFALLNQAVSSL